MELKVLELFGGIGAIRKALERISVPFKVVDYVEIDKYAVNSYNAMFNENYEPQDICNWNKDIEVDLLMHGSPCQDFSVCGLNKGGDEGTGTRSSLMWETVRIITKLKPKYVIWENVKNVISKKHKHNFDKYINELVELGYNSYYQVLNAKDYGIPQNRERVFTISIRKDIDKGSFVFPVKQELKLKLKDLLENKVDEKYYLSETQINRITTTNYNDSNHFVAEKNLKQKLCDKLIKNNIVKEGDIINHSYTNSNQRDTLDKYIESNNGISPTLTTRSDILGVTVDDSKSKLFIKNNTSLGYLEAEDGDGIYTNISNKRGTVQKEMIPALTSLQDKGVVIDERNY